MAGLARWCFRHRYIVLILWVVALVVLGGAAKSAGNAYANTFSSHGTDSTAANDLLKSAFPSTSGDVDTIVFKVSEGSVTDSAVEQKMTQTLNQVAHLPHVADVKSPYAAGNKNQISSDGKIAYASITFDQQAYLLHNGDIKTVVSTAQAAKSSTLDVELGGAAISNANEQKQSTSEFIGYIAAAIVLFIAFGSLFAMLLPLLTAIIALGVSVSLVTLLTHVTAIASLAPILCALIGIGVGIDYALFVITRSRNGIKSGMTPEEAAVTALNTSGRAVIFAGATVCIALLGMLVTGSSFLYGIAYCAALTVALTVFASITLLPAFLGILGRKVLSRRERKKLAATGPFDVHASGFWARWAAFVQRRPKSLAAVAVVVLAALIIPVFGIRLGSSDQGNDPKSTTTRQAYDLLAEGFGPGFNGPLQLVGSVGSQADTAAFQQLEQTVKGLPGVANVIAPPIKDGAKVAVANVIPSTSPESKQTTALVHTLRDTVIPQAEKGTTMQVHVGGITAIYVDFAKSLGAKMLLFIAVIIGLGFLLLLFAFRSLVVPLTAAVMNLLAAAASFGVLTAIFEWGWGSEAMGLGKGGPIEAWLPVFALSILFGLSMDYQVFLVSRMHEEWVNTGDNRTAVRVGQAATGRVITAAGTIMILVFLSFVLGGQRAVAEFGIGLASAVFIDAFILRTVLVPALMNLFGKANWWLPGWLDRKLPHVSVEPAAALPQRRSAAEDEFAPTH